MKRKLPANYNNHCWYCLLHFPAIQANHQSCTHWNSNWFVTRNCHSNFLTGLNTTPTATQCITWLWQIGLAVDSVAKADCTKMVYVPAMHMKWTLNYVHTSIKSSHGYKAFSRLSQNHVKTKPINKSQLKLFIKTCSLELTAEEMETYQSQRIK